MYWKVGIVKINNFKKILVGLLTHINILDWSVFQTVQTIVINYHVISDDKIPHIQHLYNYKNLRQFENDLIYFSTYLNKISLEKLISGRVGEQADKSYFLTFDDGCSEVYTVIEPLLRKYDIKAAFMLNPAFIDNKEMFYRHKISLIIDELMKVNITSQQDKKIREILNSDIKKTNNAIADIKAISYANRYMTDEIADIIGISFKDYLRNKKPYLESWQIEELISKGHYIGAHSMDHPLFKNISLNEQVLQTIESMKWVTERFSLPYNIFSIPHVDNEISNAYFDEVIQKGKIDLIFGNSNLRKERKCRNVIHRIIGENPDYNLQAFINAHLVYHFMGNLFGYNYIKRK